MPRGPTRTGRAARCGKAWTRRCVLSRRPRAARVLSAMRDHPAPRPRSSTPSTSSPTCTPRRCRGARPKTPGAGRRVSSSASTRASLDYSRTRKARGGAGPSSGAGELSRCVTHSPESPPSGRRTGFGGPTPPESSPAPDARPGHTGCIREQSRLDRGAACSILGAPSQPRRAGARVPTNRPGGMRMRALTSLVSGVLALTLAAAVPAQDLPKVTIAMSGWTGFAPLSLAEKAGIFKTHGVDVTIKFIPQKDRHLAIASGDVPCAATTVETWVVWNANGVATKQVLQLDKSYGADGMVVRNNIGKIADLKGKTV